MGRAEAVCACVTAADDDDLLAFRRDELVIGNRVAFTTFVLERKIVHGEVNAVEFASGNRKVAWQGSAAGEQDRVVVFLQFIGGNVHPDVGVGAERHALGGQDVEPPVQDGFLH